MAATDVLSLEVAKDLLDIGEDDDSADTALARVVSAVSDRLDLGVGPIVQRTITDERISSRGGCSLWVRQFPVKAFTSITETTGTTPLVLAATDWVAEPYEHDPALFSGELVRQSGGYDIAWACGRLNVKATYDAGRFADTASVGGKFAEAAALMLRNAWRAYEQAVGEVGEYEVPAQSFPAFSVPKAVVELLAGEWQDLPGHA